MDQSGAIVNYGTSVVPLDQVSKINEAKQKQQTGWMKEDPQEANAFQAYVPNVFRLPVPGVAPYAKVDIEVIYVENLPFKQGTYFVHVPLKFPAGVLFSAPQNAITINCNICTGTPFCQWGGCSIPMTTLHEVPGNIRLTTDPAAQWPAFFDFDINYFILYVLLYCIFTLQTEGHTNFTCDNTRRQSNVQ